MRGTSRRLAWFGACVALVVAGCTTPGGDTTEPTGFDEPGPIDPRPLPPLRDPAPSSTTASVLPAGGPVPTNAPAAVERREPLPYCGADITPLMATSVFEGLVHDEGAHACFHARVEADLPVELIRVRFSLEGDPIVVILRRLPDGAVEMLFDATRDNLGDRAWFLYECDGYDTAISEPTGCAEPIRFDSA